MKAKDNKWQWPYILCIHTHARAQAFTFIKSWWIPQFQNWHPGGFLPKGGWLWHSTHCQDLWLAWRRFAERHVPLQSLSGKWAKVAGRPLESSESKLSMWKQHFTTHHPTWERRGWRGCVHPRCCADQRLHHGAVWDSRARRRATGVPYKHACVINTCTFIEHHHLWRSNVMGLLTDHSLSWSNHLALPRPFPHMEKAIKNSAGIITCDKCKAVQQSVWWRVLVTEKVMDVAILRRYMNILTHTHKYYSAIRCWICSLRHESPRGMGK